MDQSEQRPQHSVAVSDRQIEDGLSDGSFRMGAEKDQLGNENSRIATVDVGVNSVEPRGQSRQLMGHRTEVVIPCPALGSNAPPFLPFDQPSRMPESGHRVLKAVVQLP
ncbi:hypothetical protein [Mesorhizobium sp. ZC-5]|uniref:hypothetical protein n=1 Tax=Mesorhizobium sp. ZC-5 TaxID=2986066 RepID=UPI0021E920B4|nr:hypothetical protein [Mesorhizobium sp. ZC-5]MCV3244092.1 hypothetical protein [Mesorhizobium sp. ZC-5]